MILSIQLSFYLHGFSDPFLLAYGACVYLKPVTK